MLPQNIKAAWKSKSGPIVFSTISANNQPNAIYATCVSLHSSDKILIADNFFNKTKENIDNHSLGSVLFITDDDKSYQLKGTLNYFTQGKLYDDMKSWNPENLPGYGVVALSVTEVYQGADKIL